MTERVHVLVVGAGPAGLAAATAASHAGRVVVVLDDNAGAGGQIWRGPHNADPTKARRLAQFQKSGAVLLPGRRVFDAPEKSLLRAVVEGASGTSVQTFQWDRLIIATGARERFLPFPGWTLPGVFGAGGLQALVQGGFSVAGKRIVVAGAGPLLLAVAAHLRGYGAKIVSIAEQAPLSRMVRFAGRLWSHPAKLILGAKYRASLAGVPYRMGCWPTAAQGTAHLTGVRLTDGRRHWTEPCDLLACGFHLVPNTELAELLGCRLEDDAVAVDGDQQTSVPDVFCAGEPTGIAGLDAALVSGEIAGFAASGQASQARALHRRNLAERAFGHRLHRAFALRPELRQLPSADTIVCRCEDIRYGELLHHPSWTEAKLQTRCGMGPCQGRVCGPALQTLFGWRNASIRPPLFPVPVSAFCATASTLKETL